jgi:hypothetical protein
MTVIKQSQSEASIMARQMEGPGTLMLSSWVDLWHQPVKLGGKRAVHHRGQDPSSRGSVFWANSVLASFSLDPRSLCYSRGKLGQEIIPRQRFTLSFLFLF